MSIGTLRDKLNRDLRMAMKARDQVTVSTLRTLIAALDNAEAVPVDLASLPTVPTTERYEVPRKELTGEAIHQLLEWELAERQRAHDKYLTWGRTDEAARLQLYFALNGNRSFYLWSKLRFPFQPQYRNEIDCCLYDWRLIPFEEVSQIRVDNPIISTLYS